MLWNDDKPHFCGLICGLLGVLNFTSCFHMVIIHCGDKTHIVYELQAHLRFLYGLPATMATKNKQSAIRPCKTKVTDDRFLLRKFCNFAI